MKGRGWRIAVVTMMGLASPAAVLAGQSCSVWMDQGDGTSWTTCVDDSGTQTCWRINNASGSTAYQVACG